MNWKSRFFLSLVLYGIGIGILWPTIKEYWAFGMQMLAKYPVEYTLGFISIAAGYFVAISTYSK